MTVGVPHLRLLAVLGGAGSLTRAARELGVTQPTASRMLRELEDHLGAHLVDRSPQGARLTASGRELARRAAPAVQEIDDLLGAPGPAPVVAFAWSGLEDSMAAAVRAWQEAHPGQACRIRRAPDPVHDLQERRADVAVIRGCAARDAPGLVSRVLYLEDRLAAIPSGSPLAGRSRAHLADLDALTLVLNAAGGSTRAEELWPAGGGPARRMRVEGVEEWLAAIATGDDRCGITPASTPGHSTHPGVRYLPLDGCPPVPVVLVHRADERRAAVLELVDLVLERA